MAKFYIATSLKRRADHNCIRDLLIALGHEITYDWTKHGSVKSVSFDLLQEVAINEVKGVLDADILIALLPGGFGTHAELGMGLSLGLPIILHSEIEAPFTLGEQTCAFYHHSNVSQVVCSLKEPMLLVEAFAKSADAALLTL